MSTTDATKPGSATTTAAASATRPAIVTFAVIHAENGATHDLARLDLILKGHGVKRKRSPSRPTHGWESLSPTERKVVALVARGQSNPRIAAGLFISRRTVETHVSHIFRKLDVTSRAELAAAAATHGYAPSS